MSTYCELCVLEFNHKRIYVNHLGSKSHLNALHFQEQAKTGNLRTSFYCTLCSLCADTNAVLEKHLNSQKHLIKVTLKQKYENLSHFVRAPRENFRSIAISKTCPDLKQRALAESNSLEKICSDSDWCHCCFCKYTSSSHKQSHLNGKYTAYIL